MRSHVLALVSLAVAMPLALAAPASAGERPLAGQCFDITVGQSDDVLWPDVPAVSCSDPHTIEIVKASPLPADVDAAQFAHDNCVHADVMRSVGINVPIAGVVANPIRMGVFPSIVNGDGEPASFACSIGALRYNGSADDTFEPLTSSVAGMTAAQLRALRFCVSGRDRDPGTKDVTVSCTANPRWQVTAWVELGQLYATYPGASAARKRTKNLCPRAAVLTTPSAAAWAQGYTRAWCWKQILLNVR